MKRREFLMAGVAAAVSSALPSVVSGDESYCAIIHADGSSSYFPSVKFDSNNLKKAVDVLNSNNEPECEWVSIHSYNELPFEFGSVDCPVRFIKCG